MNKYVAGLAAGFIATVVLSMMMVAKAQMGLMPDLNVIAMLSRMAHAKMSLPASPVTGWVLHFMIGTVAWGLAFATLFHRIPGTKAWQKGILFAIGAWVLMMVGPMPMAGAGLFGSHLGMAAPVMTLMLHILFGAVLGASYALLQRKTHVFQSA